MTWSQLIRRTLLAAGLAMLGIAIALPSPARAVSGCGVEGEIICSVTCTKVCEDEEGNHFCCAFGIKVKIEPE